MAQNSDITEKFFQLLRYAINEHAQAPHIEADEWETMHDMAKKQSIVGVVFKSVQRMGQDATIPRQLRMRWFFQVGQIKNRNMLLNQRSAELVKMLQQDGFDCCVLKGQGNAMMYPNPYVRSTGDIDLQVKGGRDKVVEYVRKRFPHTKIRYQHIDYKVFPDVPVEIHFIPTFMNNPLYNRRIQTWMEGQMAEQCQNKVDLPDGAGQIAVPAATFNIVYQLAHLMRHFFDEGIGLRQFMDYYYLLLTAKDKRETERAELEMLFRRLGLWKFAGATMYVMREVFSLEEDFLIAPVDERRGKTLVAEILKGGNFGKHSGLTEHSTGVKFFAKSWRNLHFVHEYPAEALCEPFFRTWHYFWRLKHS